MINILSAAASFARVTHLKVVAHTTDRYHQLHGWNKAVMRPLRTSMWETTLDSRDGEHSTKVSIKNYINWVYGRHVDRNSDNCNTR